MLYKLLISDHPPFPWKAEPVQVPYEGDSQNNAAAFALHYDTRAKFTIPICVYVFFKIYSIVNIYVNMYVNIVIKYILCI